MNITEFLTVRVEEDATRAEYVEKYGDTGGLFSPARVLAECAAKRAIIEMHETYSSAANESVGIAFVGARSGQQVTADTLRALAAVYKDHPDYKTEWVDDTWEDTPSRN